VAVDVAGVNAESVKVNGQSYPSTAIDVSPCANVNIGGDHE
jgi:hypothetical protein